MSKPASWLPRLHEIRKTVGDSVRSHYERTDLEKLFQLQPRAAGKLMKSLPKTAVGSAHLVKREDLAAFLERVFEAGNVGAVFKAMRADMERVSRKKLRSLVQRDVAPASLEGMPLAIQLVPGELRVTFVRTEDLAIALLQVARLLEEQGDEFARLYEVKEVSTEDELAKADLQVLNAELEEMQKARVGDGV